MLEPYFKVSSRCISTCQLKLLAVNFQLKSRPISEPPARDLNKAGHVPNMAIATADSNLCWQGIDCVAGGANAY